MVTEKVKYKTKVKSHKNKENKQKKTRNQSAFISKKKFDKHKKIKRKSTRDKSSIQIISKSINYLDNLALRPRSSSINDIRTSVNFQKKLKLKFLMKD